MVSYESAQQAEQQEPVKEPEPAEEPKPVEEPESENSAEEPESAEQQEPVKEPEPAEEPKPVEEPESENSAEEPESAEQPDTKNEGSTSEGDYSKEFERRMLLVETVDPKNYTLDMFKEDMAYLHEWFQYERAHYKELLRRYTEELRKRTRETVGNPTARQELFVWAQATVGEMNSWFEAKKQEIWSFQDRVRRTYQNKGTSQEGATKEEKEQENKKDEKKEQNRDTKKDSNEQPPKKEKPKKADSVQVEQLAISGLGISHEEYKILTGRIDTLPSDYLWDLLKRVLKIEDTDKKSVRTAYYELIKVLHPDTGGTEFEKEVKSAKIQVVNNLYGEYKKRYR